MGRSILFAGAGALSQATANELTAPAWQCYGLRRRTDQLPAEWLPVIADLLGANDLPAQWPESLEYLVIALTPDERSEAAYRAVYLQGQQRLYDWLATAGQRPRRVFFISSTGVYGQSQGEWVDESSVTQPERWSGQVLCDAEQLALASGYPCTVVRLAGIYGGARQSFLRRVRQGYHAEGTHNRITNRIHEQDAAALLAYLIELDSQGQPLASIYLGVDDCPVEQSEVVRWLQQQLGVTTNLEKRLTQAGTSKQCSNARARATGWQPRYPSYREGYLPML